MSKAVAAHLTMRLITGEDRGRDLAVECRYEAGDPYAVRLDFGGGEETVWVLARDLLAAGLRGPAGDGDVHIEPSATGRHVLIALGGQDGVALLDTPARPLARFLTATGRTVPVGSESARIDWDGWLRGLLSA